MNAESEAENRNKTSVPKLKLIEFLKNSNAEEEYQLVIPVPASNAEAFVHRMRVELSRFRVKVRERNRVPKSFKVLLLKNKDGSKRIEPIDKDTCKVYLKKSTSGHEVDDFIDDIFDEVAGGRVLEV